MKVVILGGGPAGLYAGILIKKARPRDEVCVIERNAADITYGWGVVFSDRTLSAFQRADYPTYEQITSHFVIWDAIDTCYRGTTLRCGGHVIASIARKQLLRILQQRCLQLGVTLRFEQEVHALSELEPYDLLIAADGINSLVRQSHQERFRPTIEVGNARYIWLGADKVLDAFTFLFYENQHGLFQVHAYPFSGTTSTFIIECDEQSWLNAGLDQADEARSLAYCQGLLNEFLGGMPLLSNNSRWINFPTLKTARWYHQRLVLLGDAAHTAHFSIGSGTKLAMEDAISLAAALEKYSVAQALNAYEMERKPVVEVFQRAARESRIYFETVRRYLSLEPLPFTFQLLTRSGRISYDDLKFRDARFGEAIDRWWHQSCSSLVAPPPLVAPFQLRDLTLANRVVTSTPSPPAACAGLLSDHYKEQLYRQARNGAGLLITGITAVSAQGRITPECAGLYTEEHSRAWASSLAELHSSSPIKVALSLGHAGRRGATRPRHSGLDHPLLHEGWPLLAPSPLPYTSLSVQPLEMQRAEMDQVIAEFVQATQMAQRANFDLLHLHFAHGYLIASFLSPLTNQRQDAYGGSPQNRMRFPLEVFAAIRAVWPQHKPLAVALCADDCARGGADIEDAVAFASALKAHGCDLIEVLAGQTTPASEPSYGRGYLTLYSDHIRNRAHLPTLVGGHLTTQNDLNTVLAAGRADLCIRVSN
jgi:anthraniloyl-CoA monooxygenase